MTCIVGLVQNGHVYMGGDSAGVAGYELVLRRDPKVFRVGPFVIGFTSSFRMGQLLHYKLAAPGRTTSQDVAAYMATDFVDAVRTCLQTGGYARKENEEETAGTFLVGYSGRLFTIDSDYQVGESIDNFAAVGCGAQVALGALFATPQRPPRERLTTALKAAERHSAGVRGPFAFETLKATA